MGADGFTLWFTGLSGAGKTTLSSAVAERLRRSGRKVEVLDGDLVRLNLCRGLGFSVEDRHVNVRRIGLVARLLSRNGVVAIVAAISPFRAIRDEVRRAIEDDGAGFCEVYVSCPLEVLVARDRKGLYRRALAGEIPDFTGVSQAYEPPETPEVTVDSSREEIAASLEKVFAALERRGWVATDV